MRGQISQGICFPLSILSKEISVEEGKDLTELLDVKQFEPPIPFYLEEYILDTDMKSLVELSIGKSLINKEGWREGIKAHIF